MLPNIPLTDLHRHLDGSLRPETLSEFALAEGLEVPPDLHFFPGMGLTGALAKFEFTLSLLKTPEAVRRVAGEMCEDAEAEGVGTLEIRFAPQLHVGAPDGEIVDAALEGIDGRAGLILCGLYGEPPAVLEGHVALATSRPGVVGVDLAGGPAAGDDWSMEDYRGAFERARVLGLGRTVHAGEGRPPAEIATAIRVLGANRIGHGTTLLEDDEVVALVIDGGVTIEACPTSNWQVGVIDSVADHPISALLDRGVRVCVNCDNTLLSQVDARTELGRVAEIAGMTPERLEAVVRFGRAAAFRR